ncbi:MAG TPA: hypothetical protein PLR06_10535 [Cyclobacteriaceae bacterium]|nr:hypothetical protein [Cyclobacteriaceae bacterium]
MATFITALPFLSSPWDSFISQDYFLVVITLIFSFLLVAPMELFALKLKNFQWRENKVQFTFVVLAVLLIGVGQASAIPFIILLYILASLLKNWMRI